MSRRIRFREFTNYAEASKFHKIPDNRVKRTWIEQVNEHLYKV